MKFYLPTYHGASNITATNNYIYDSCERQLTSYRGFFDNVASYNMHMCDLWDVFNTDIAMLHLYDVYDKCQGNLDVFIHYCHVLRRVCGQNRPSKSTAIIESYTHMELQQLLSDSYKQVNARYTQLCALFESDVYEILPYVVFYHMIEARSKGIDFSFRFLHLYQIELFYIDMSDVVLEKPRPTFHTLYHGYKRRLYNVKTHRWVKHTDTSLKYRKISDVPQLKTSVTQSLKTCIPHIYNMHPLHQLQYITYANMRGIDWKPLSYEACLSMHFGPEYVLLFLPTLPQYKMNYGKGNTDTYKKCHTPTYVVHHTVTGKVLFVYEDLACVEVVKNWWSLYHDHIAEEMFKACDTSLPHYRTIPNYRFHRWQILAPDIKIVSLDTHTQDPTTLHNALEWLAKPVVPTQQADYYASQAERYNYHTHALGLHPIYFYLLQTQ